MAERQAVVARPEWVGHLGELVFTKTEQQARARAEETPAPQKAELRQEVPVRREKERPPQAERAEERRADAPAQPKTNLDWDIIQGETERKEKPRRRGGGKEFNPTVD